MTNVIPPNHVDDVPVVEPDQHHDVYVIPELVLVDEDEDPKEDEFEEEEDPQEEEDDMEVGIEEDENEPELTYPYEEMDPLNPSPPAFNVHELGESSTASFLYEDSDDLLPGLMRRDINSLFSRMASLSRRLCGHETAHALVEKKGNAKDEFYGKLILYLGNEVRSSVEQGMATMEKLVEKLGNAEDKVECKKLKKELVEARIMPLKFTPLTQAAIRQMIKDNVDAAIAADTDEAVELMRWFEKTKSVFRISECAEGKKTHHSKRDGKTAYDVFRERSLDISYFYVFRYPVHIHNHRDHLGKFDEKADDGFFLGYSLVEKAFRVFNIRRQEMEETYHVTFSEADEAISQSRTEGDAINFNKNRSFHDDEFHKPRNKVTQGFGNIKYFLYISTYETIPKNITPTNSPILQDFVSPVKPLEFTSADDHPTLNEHDLSEYADILEPAEIQNTIINEPISDV
nr:hypothetical protein [Tanacetum cinerariifolium]